MLDWVTTYALEFATTVFGLGLLYFVNRSSDHENTLIELRQQVKSLSNLQELVAQVAASLNELKNANYRIERIETDMYAAQLSIEKIRKENHDIRDSQAGIHIERENARERRKDNDRKFELLDKRIEFFDAKVDKIYDKLDSIAEKQSHNFEMIVQMINLKVNK